MAPSRGPLILMAAGIVLIAGALALVQWLARSPGDPETFHWNEDEIEGGFKRLREEKAHCESQITTALERDRMGFEAIVRAVEKQGLVEGQSEEFFFPRGGSPNPLRTVKEAFDRAELGEFSKKNTLVRAYRRGGILFVKVVICEMGHAGTYAVMYSSKELTEKEIQDQLVPNATERLDPHWWAVVEWY